MPKHRFSILIWLYFFTSCLTISESKITILKEGYNKNHTKKFVLFLKEAGATVTDSYQVSILDVNKELDDKSTGNTFIVDVSHKGRVLDSTSIILHWSDNGIIEIEYNKNQEIFNQQLQVGNTKIVYIQNQ